MDFYERLRHLHDLEEEEEGTGDNVKKPFTVTKVVGASSPKHLVNIFSKDEFIEDLNRRMIERFASDPFRISKMVQDDEYIKKRKMDLELRKYRD